MKLIFGVDKNFAIGLDGDMLFHIREDLARFKKLTTGNIIVMGRKTLISLPNSKPLPNRTNVVLSSDPSLDELDLIRVKSTDELFETLKKINPDKAKEEFLVGGGKLTATLLEHCDCAYITMMQHAYDIADTWIPNLDCDKSWELVSESEPHPFQDTFYTYREYRRIK